MSQRRQVNPLALIVIAGGAAMGAPMYFGIREPQFVALFVVALMLPVPRMVLHDKPQSLPTLQIAIDRREYGPFCLALLGALPWMVLPWLYRSYPESVLWQTLNVPDWLRWCGALLACGLVFTPWMNQSLAAASCDEAERRLTPFAISAASIVLISANLFIVLVAAAGLAALWTIPRYDAGQPAPETAPASSAAARYYLDASPAGLDAALLQR